MSITRNGAIGGGGGGSNTNGSAYGEITLIGNVVATTLTVQNTWYQILPVAWTSDQAPVRMTVNGAAGTITAGAGSSFATIATIAFTSSAAPNTVEFAIFKDGTQIVDHKAITWTDTNTYPNTVSVTGIDTLANGNVLDIRARCTTAGPIDIVVTDANFSVFSISGVPASGSILGSGVSGQVTIWSAPNTITGDTGCTWTGTGSNFVLAVSSAQVNGLLDVQGSFMRVLGPGGAGAYWANDGSRQYLRNSYQFAWSFDGTYYGTPDLALSRASAGLLLVEDGSGNPRDVQARTVLAGDGTAVAPSFASATTPSSGMFFPTGIPVISHAGVGSLAITQAGSIGLQLLQSLPLSWAAGALGGASNLALSRPSDGLLLVHDGSGNARDVQARTGTFGTSVVTPLVSSAGTLTLQENAGGGPKTIYFQSGAFFPASNNTHDLGVGSGLLWRTGYFGTSVVTPVLDAPAAGFLTLNEHTGNKTIYFAGSALYPASDNSTSFGLGTNRYNSGYFGTSLYSPLLSAATDATGTNTAGVDLTVQPQAGTGNATGSSLIFQTPTATVSGTGAQTQTTRLAIKEGHFNVASLPVYANNAAALAGNLVAGDLYRTGADPDPVCVVH